MPRVGRMWPRVSDLKRTEMRQATWRGHRKRGTMSLLLQRIVKAPETRPAGPTTHFLDRKPKTKASE